MVDSFSALLMVLICCVLRIRTFATAEGYEELVMNRSVNILCLGNDMTILLTKKHLPSFNHSSFHLNNNSCTGHQLNHSHLVLQTGLSGCGTIKRRFNGSYIYVNLLQGSLNNPNNYSSWNISTTFAVQCKKPSLPAMRNLTTSGFGKNLSKVGSEEVYVKAESKPQKIGLLAHEAKITKPPKIKFQAVKTETVNNGEVSFKAQVLTKGRKEGLVQIAIEDCRATPDGNFDSKDGVTLIENGCVKKPGLCGYMFKSRSSSQTISYKVSGSSNQEPRPLYLHCRFVLCPPKDDRLSLCRIGCGGVSEKIISKHYVTVVSHAGPVTINAAKTQGPRSRMLDLAIVKGGAVFLLLVVVGILTFYCKRRLRLKGRDTLLDNEEGLSDNERGFDQVNDTDVFEESSKMQEPQLSDETDSCSILEGRKLFLNMDWTTV